MRCRAPQRPWRHVSKEAPTRTHTTRSTPVAAMDCQNRMVDPAMVYFSCRLSCRAESRHLLSFAVQPAKQSATVRDSSTGRNDNDASCDLTADDFIVRRRWEIAAKLGRDVSDRGT